MEKINLALTVLFSGLVVVFFALIILTFIIKWYGKIINKIASINTLKRSEEQKEKEGIAGSPYNKEQITNEIIAAISAAVYSIYGYSHRVHSVKRIRCSSLNRPIWNIAGTFENTHPF